jgi:hypothetical protein
MPPFGRSCVAWQESRNTNDSFVSHRTVSISFATHSNRIAQPSVSSPHRTNFRNIARRCGLLLLHKKSGIEKPSKPPLFYRLAKPKSASILGLLAV